MSGASRDGGDSWGIGQLPLIPVEELPPLPPRLADLAELTTLRPLSAGEDPDIPVADDLPEVQALVEDGWYALDDEPLWQWLPLVWPPSHRGWVVDRLPRIGFAYCLDGRRWIEPWDEERTAQVRGDVVSAAVDLGLPPPPAGRRWFVRSPWPSLAVPTILSVICSRTEELQQDIPYGTLSATREVLAWTEDEVWERWLGEQADVARAWRERGRTGADVASLIGRRLGPSDLEELMTPTADGLPGLTEKSACRWIDAFRAYGPDGAAEVQRWRRVLGPDVEPADLPEMFADSEVDPDTAGQWLALGFSLYDTAVLAGMPLRVASAWRDAGFSGEVTRDLLAADNLLTPEEASAFRSTGIAADQWVAWIEHGFSAAEARTWTDAGVYPNEARVWRFAGLRPGDVEDPRPSDEPVLPPGLEVGWAGYGTGRAQRNYGVTDPPGTRGRVAEQARTGRHFTS